MKVVPTSFSYTSSLASKYINAFTEVSHLYEHDPFSVDSFMERHKRVMADYHTDRGTLVSILHEYNKSLNCGEKTQANLDKLAQEDTVVIVTGQQAGVLTGPLYTVYKAITAIQLAAKVEKTAGLKVVPMFWVAAEDHDYAEIDHIDFLNKTHELTRLKLEYQPDKKMSIGSIPVPDEIFRLIEDLDENTNPSEWKDALISELKKLAETYGNLADWFAAIMANLFSRYGLIIINPMLPELRKMMANSFKEFILKADLVSDKLAKGIKKVKDLGFEPQVTKEENNINMFLYVDGERQPLFKTDNGYTARGSDKTWALEEILKIAESHPEMLSPNVVLRPVVQDVLLPILAYVAGPGEISYYGLYREIYPLFEERMPVIYPRTNVTIIERAVAKSMAKYHVNFDDGAEGIKEKLASYLQEQDRIGIDALFENYEKELKNSFAGLSVKVSEIDTQLKGHGEEALNKMVYQLEHFHKKVHQYHRKSMDSAVSKFRQMENNLFPMRSWQERIFNIFPYLFKYGPYFIEELTELPLLEGKGHKLIYT